MQKPAEARNPPALIVCGPTTSGKSALALELAEMLGGTVINADAMQCYAGMAVITAQPGPEDTARAPHRLYGVRDPAQAADVAWWREAALAEMAQARLPILCGGTGMYLRALTQGLSALSEVPEPARAEARALLAERGPEALHALLDPETAAKLRPGDSQRVTRALEIQIATGRGLAAWQREAPVLPPAPWDFSAILLDPPREALRAAIAARFDAMLAGGAIEEVRALLPLDPALPAMRAHGVPELRAMLLGEMTPAQARERAILNTGQYTKRQATWFRHQALVAPSALHMIHARFAGLAQFSESEQEKLVTFVRNAVDAASRQA
ncbi:tRNA (adenosine(37)-N6)-dimethylallyltransferase MiaA [Rhodovarius lipocyclicus]|uniref:tRNA (adenosine(37)-N6)-dimethylallyltransferase MiaA n=1 Tax=Rhodovarius lipocyclicus TaxID=268410 RepID=UPI00135BB9F2|nr:tRNA (adenosine(37)-N6)-dimethylallyltransferase MiaA [Rhodovarius lipocyclicus]